ncbi:MAG: putative Ig domain-containing protein, partial [Longimicrobiales bacterium]
YSAVLEDKKGNPITGGTISWTSTDPSVASVSGSGLAQGLKKGTTSIQATSEGLTGRATLTVSPLPAEVLKNAGDGQSGALSQPLPEALVVEVLDSEGHPVQGADVSFVVTVGGGSISPTLATTDAQGRATAAWTLGCSNDDPQRVVASIGGRSVEFTASADLSLPAICQESIPDGRVTFDYSVQLEVVGGDQASMAWTVESGSLPAGIGLSATGVLAGSPEAPGSFLFRARAQDGMGNSAARDFGLRICEAPLDMDPGETLSLQPSGSTGCGFFLPAGTAGDRYRIGVLWSTSNPADTLGLPLVTVSVLEQTGATGAAAATVAARRFDAPMEPQDWLEGLPGPFGEALEVEAATEAFHNRLRDQEWRMIQEMGPGARLLPDLMLPERVFGAQSAAPAKISVFANPNSQCTPLTARVTALKVAERDHVVLYQDSAQAQIDSLKVTTALADMMLDYYEDYGKQVIDEYFDGVSDIDGDGRITVFATPVVGENVAAYVWSGDFFDAESCANSNEMELVRFNSKVIRGMLTGNYQALATLVHEAKHVSSLYKSISRYYASGGVDPGYHPGWIEEGTAEIAGEMSSRLAWEATGGPAVGSMIRRSDKVISEESYGVLLRWVRTIFYLYSQPNGVVGTPQGALSDHSVYGSGWHFHRWLGDSYGEAASARLADGPFFISLNDSLIASGDQGIRDVTGKSWEELLDQYASATMLIGTGAPQPEWAFTSYDFPDVTTGLLQAPHQPPGFYPWPVNVSGDNPSQTFGSFVSAGTLGPSGLRVYDLTSDGTGDGISVKVSTTKDPIRIVVVRLD